MSTKALTSTERHRLVNLEAKLDQYLFGQHYDEKSGKMVDDGSILPSVGTIATGAGVVGGGYAGYKGVQAVQGKMGSLGVAANRGGEAASSAAAKAFRESSTLSKAGQATGAVGHDIMDYVRKKSASLIGQVA